MNMNSDGVISAAKDVRCYYKIVFQILAVGLFLSFTSGFAIMIAFPDPASSSVLSSIFLSVVLAGTAGIVLVGLSIFLFAKIFLPLNDAESEVLRRFPFNEPAIAHLRDVVAKHQKVSFFALRKALKLHFKHENAQNRKEALQRFTRQS